MEGSDGARDGSLHAAIPSMHVHDVAAMNPRLARSSPSPPGADGGSEKEGVGGGGVRGAQLRPVRPARPTGYTSPQLSRAAPPKPMGPRLRANSNNRSSGARANTSPTLDSASVPTVSRSASSDGTTRPQSSSGARPRSETTATPGGTQDGVVYRNQISSANERTRSGARSGKGSFNRPTRPPPTRPLSSQSTSSTEGGGAASPSRSTGSRTLDRAATLEAIPDHFYADITPGDEDEDEDGADGGTDEGAEALSSDTATASFVRTQMSTRAAEFTEFDLMRVCVCSYNVNGRKPPRVDDDGQGLRPWIMFPPGEAAEIYAIGFQELDLSKETFVFNNSNLEHDWSQGIEEAFHGGHTYIRVASKQLVGMLLIIYAKAEISTYIKNVSTDAQGTGIFGTMGNKGAVSIRFDLHSTSCCFVASHLCAHDENVLKRNHDYHEILKRVQLNMPSTAKEPAPRSILQHDYVFWCGDLNYRITSLPGSTVKDMLKLEKYEALVPVDQLAEERASGNVFNGFQEADITFPPTYKYTPGTDSLENKKLQTPAWCDRVLFKSGEDSQITPLLYESVPAMRLSDHKPIRSVLECSIRMINEERQAEVRQEVLRSLDAFENSARPEVSVSAHEFDFPKLKFMQQQKLTCKISNTGKSVAKFSCAPQPGDVMSIPDWLSISPQSGIVAPGESLELKLMAKAHGWRCVSALNAGTKVDDYILILRVQNGGDIFIAISGSFVRSSFGMPLEQLILLPTPAAVVPPGPAVALRPGSAPMLVPKELWRLVDFLANEGMENENLFLLKGRVHQVAAARDCLDTGAEFPTGIDVHSVAEVLIQFLQTLTEPVIPVNQYAVCLDSVTPQVSQLIAQNFPAVHRTTFQYLIAFLKERLKRSSVNASSAASLAVVFGRVLMRPPKELVQVGRRAQTSQMRQQATFVLHFIE